MNSLTGLGDVNGDDTPDIGIGTYTAVAFGRSTASGALFAISGDKIGAGNRIDLAESSSYLFAVGGAFAGHRLGISIDSAGDVDGDGLQDIVAGADSTAGANSDAAYVIYGAETGTDPGSDRTASCWTRPPSGPTATASAAAPATAPATACPGSATSTVTTSTTWR